MTTEPDFDDPSAVSPDLAPALYSDSQILEYVLSVLLNENLSIPAPNCAVHTAAVNWLAERR